MDNYQKIKNINGSPQHILIGIKNISIALDQTENSLRKKISQVNDELHNLEKDFCNTIEIYNQIIKSSKNNNK